MMPQVTKTQAQAQVTLRGLPSQINKENPRAEIKYGALMRSTQWKATVVRTADDVMCNHTLAFAAALSYYFVMAFFPALIALAAIIAYLPLPDVFNTMVGTLSRVMSQESMGLVRKIASQIITP